MVAWNDLNICERFGWRLEDVKAMSLEDYNHTLQFIDASHKIATSKLRKE